MIDFERLNHASISDDTDLTAIPVDALLQLITAMAAIHYGLIKNIILTSSPCGPRGSTECGLAVAIIGLIRGVNRTSRSAVDALKFHAKTAGEHEKEDAERVIASTEELVNEMTEETGLFLSGDMYGLKNAIDDKVSRAKREVKFRKLGPEESRNSAPYVQPKKETFH